jgi:D-mannonate dehydratase
MSKLNRRECMQGMLATVAAAAAPAVARAAPASPAGRGGASGEEKIKICLVWPGQLPHLAKVAKQIGVTHSIAGTATELSKVPRARYLDTIAKIKSTYDEEGLTIAGVESHPVPADKIKLGLPGRDEQIENYIAAIKAFGELGIPMICYEFMAGIGWYRTNLHYRGRGDSVTMNFVLRDAKKLGLTKWGRISQDQMWQNMEYFLKAIIPAAEKANVKMALHPDDPPVPELRGIARIVTNGAGYRRVMSIVPSPVNGITFDHSVMYLTGEDIKALAKEWCSQNKVFFIHARNLKGTLDHFVETFQDNGVIDFGEMFQIYYDNGFRGPLRPDHDPLLDGEDGLTGYGVLGKIFAVGYIKGIMASRKIPYV